MKKIFDNITMIMYLIVSITLIIFSIIIIVYSIYDLFNNLFFNNSNLRTEENIILLVLQASWAIIISAAIVDVSKYMFEEEVLEYKKEIKRAKEARETLTKIIVIISIAVAIEWLIYIFKAWVEDIRLLVYPSILIISSTSMVVWLWIYHKITIEPNRFNNQKK